MQYTSLEAAAAGLSRLAGPVLIKALSNAAQGVASEYLVQNVRFSPVGRPQAVEINGVKYPADPHPGKLRASWRINRGKPAYARLPDAPSYPAIGAGQAAAVFRGYKIGDEIYLSNDAKTDRAKRGYADVVALLGRHVDRLGRTIGSPQAAEGTVLPAQKEVAKKAPQLILDGINRAVAQL